jgi:F-type H+-transporting ATPase subunit epsilon
MAKIKFEIATAERLVYSADDVDIVIAPGIEGEMGILPSHAPLLTMLKTGEIRIRKNGEEESFFVSGGFIEVRENKVIVLSDVAEREEEIDLAQAEEAKRRAEELLKTRPPDMDLTRAEAALRRSLTRIKIAEKKRKRKKPENLI